MADYLKLYKNHNEYDQIIDKPTWGHCIDDIELYHKKTTTLCNIITYTASAKLPETTSVKNGGLHTNQFNTTIVSHTFENGVGTIEFADDVTSIGVYAFSGSSGLITIEIPNCVTSIGSDAFGWCTNLTSISIPSGVTSIGDRAFEGCRSISSMTIDAANTVYDSRNSCNAIIKTNTNELIKGCKNTIIPDTVTSIGIWAFDKCSGLTSIYIPDSVTSIGYYAFSDCSSLTSIDIPSGVTSIGDGAFSDCSGLTSCTIGSGVTSIGKSVFYGCRNLDIFIDTNAATNGVFSGSSSIVSLTIGNNVTSIGASAFTKCYSLTSVTIGDNVTTIGDNSFSGCSGVTTAVLDGKSASLYYGPLRGFSNLKNVTIGDNTTSIYMDNANLTYCSIGSNVNKIDSSYFLGFCTGTTLICKSVVPPENAAHMFTSSSDIHLYVPAESVQAYTNAWREFVSTNIISSIEPIT